MITQAKIDKAVALLKKAERLALKYNPADGYYLAFSGGKDSQCIYHLAKLAGVKFKAHYAVTTIDPPELMRFIKTHYPDVIWERPKLTFFQLIKKKGILPHRKVRFCCSELKEKGGDGQVTITGVRRAESIKRSRRNSVEMSSHKFSGNLDQFTAAFHTDDEGLEHRCLNGKDKIIVNPIIDWSDNDVWSFIRNYLNIPYCKLYDEGFHRLGCLLCPMASAKRKREELQRYPNIKNAYLRVIEFIGKERRSKGGKNLILSEADNEEVLEWYISGKSARKFIEDKKQLKLKFEDNDEQSEIY